MLLFQGCRDDEALPEDFACLTIERHKHTIVVHSRDHEQSVAPDDRRGMTDPWNFSFPTDIARGAPMNWNIFFQTGAIPARSAPGGPIFRPGDPNRAECHCKKPDQMHAMTIAQNDAHEN